MSLRRDASVTSFFQSTGESKGKRSAETAESSMSKSDVAVPKPQNEGNDERQLSTPPPAPAHKRANTAISASDKPQNHLAYKDLLSDWLIDQTTPLEGTDDVDLKTLRLTYHIGDMFENAPKNCLLIHACNTQGHWGAGIAKAFRQHYPKAYTAYHKFCAKEHDKTKPVPTGTAQLLAPVDCDYQHWIGCLFTSAKYGKAKDKPDVIVKNTIASLQMLLELVRIGCEEVSEIRMCKINSGKFGVPWAKTEDALKSIALQEGWRENIDIWEP
jgi:ADP-ribose 1''-phosphate phosphatase